MKTRCWVPELSIHLWFLNGHLLRPLSSFKTRFRCWHPVCTLSLWGWIKSTFLRPKGGSSSEGSSVCKRKCVCLLVVVVVRYEQGAQRVHSIDPVKTGGLVIQRAAVEAKSPEREGNRLRLWLRLFHSNSNERNSLLRQVDPVAVWWISVFKFDISLEINWQLNDSYLNLPIKPWALLQTSCSALVITCSCSWIAD